MLEVFSLTRALYRRMNQYFSLFVLCLLALSLSAEDRYSGADLTGIEPIVSAVQQSAEPWRAEADQRIRQHRMADLQLTVLKSGRPVSNAHVRVRLVNHAFQFGGIVNAKRMAAGTGELSAGQYRQTFLDFGFNHAGFNNGLKYKLRKGNEHLIPEQLEWFGAHEIPVRGHCLIWPGRDHMSREMTVLVKRCKADPSEQNKQALKQMCEMQVADWAAKWDVFEWDVINETRGNFDVAKLLGEEVYIDWFNIARANCVQPHAGLYLNENRVISDTDPEVRSKKMVLYMKEVVQLLKQDAPLTGLGLQSRFHAMTPPETIYQRLCLLAGSRLSMTATEFEIGSNVEGELNKAIMTERVMTVYFSHPSVNGIYAWTLMPSGFEKAAERHILDEQGAPNLRGKVWLYLMKQRWNTDSQLTTDEDGRVGLRGFLGDYEITVENEGGMQVIPLTLSEDLQQVIRL
ncbi:Unannotated [Lentimonas sp. CC19]|nr:Unannotated [Lentimonas sp. CC19]CAA6694847.1 Unannotated [Lentimonas sp. CC10]CAA7071623.1 Unannotated [Lentimonas sp. CC11]